MTHLLIYILRTSQLTNQSKFNSKICFYSSCKLTPHLLSKFWLYKNRRSCIGYFFNSFLTINTGAYKWDMTKSVQSYQRIWSENIDSDSEIRICGNKNITNKFNKPNVHNQKKNKIKKCWLHSKLNWKQYNTRDNKKIY